MKDIYAVFSEALGKLTPAQAKQFSAKRQTGMTVETQINVLESITGKSVTESAPILKKNGRVEDLNESGRSENLSPADVFRKRSDKVLAEACGISEADQRRLNGLPGEVVNLTTTQLREYRFLRGSRFSEADALRLCKK